MDTPSDHYMLLFFININLKNSSTNQKTKRTSITQNENIVSHVIPQTRKKHRLRPMNQKKTVQEEVLD